MIAENRRCVWDDIIIKDFVLKRPHSVTLHKLHIQCTWVKLSKK